MQEMIEKKLKIGLKDKTQNPLDLENCILPLATKHLLHPSVEDLKQNLNHNKQKQGFRKALLLPVSRPV